MGLFSIWKFEVQINSEVKLSLPADKVQAELQSESIEISSKHGLALTQAANSGNTNRYQHKTTLKFSSQEL